MNRTQDGFTLIELLIVIAIIGILSSIVLTSLTDGRQKALDSKRIQDLRSISTALQMFASIYDRMPNNYNCDGVFCPIGGGDFGACDNTIPNNVGVNPLNYMPQAYDLSMQELVTAGLLPSIPHSPSPGKGYCYFNFGGWNPIYRNTVGVVVMTDLESYPLSTTGRPPSCRPFNSVGAQWCETTNSKLYCLCNPY